MTIEGDLAVRLDCDGGRVRSVRVRSTRPFAAARVLNGRTPADAVRTAPRLFSICAQAQGAAAALAIDAATGGATGAAPRAAREAAVTLEAIQEYLWRVLIDWPKVVGREADVEAVAAARRVFAPLLAEAAARALASGGHASVTESPVAADAADAIERLVARHVYGIMPAAWLELASADALAGWADRAGTLPAALLAELLARNPAPGKSDVALMPAPGPDDLRAIAVTMQAQPDFERTPTWEGMPVETGALARLKEHPLVAAVRAASGNAVPARMVARLAELAQLVTRLVDRTERGDAPRWVDGIALGVHEGLGVVQTARGMLLHRARVDGVRVTQYRIVAPTEWNFHPAGALVQGLEGADATDEDALLRDARLAVQALDPCVACRVEVAHA